MAGASSLKHEPDPEALQWRHQLNAQDVLMQTTIYTAALHAIHQILQIALRLELEIDDWMFAGGGGVPNGRCNSYNTPTPLSFPTPPGLGILSSFAYPQATTVNYIHDDLIVYFATGATSQKAGKIKLNNKVSVAIVDRAQDFYKLRGYPCRARR